MSAGKTAVPLSKENPGWLDCHWKFTCQNESCKYQGEAHELLAEPDNETLYCPVCGMAGWVWD